MEISVFVENALLFSDFTEISCIIFGLFGNVLLNVEINGSVYRYRYIFISNVIQFLSEKERLECIDSSLCPDSLW